MIYHYTKSSPEFAALEALNVHAAVEHQLLQWHRDDYTLVAEASYAILGRYVKGSRVFSSDGANTRTSLRGARKLAADLSTSGVVGESEQDDIVLFFGISGLQKTPRTCSFPDEAADLVEGFVNCIITLPDAADTDEHQTLVVDFLARLDSFLGHYKNLTLDDVVRYITKVGVPPDKARADLDVLLSLRPPVE